MATKKRCKHGRSKTTGKCRKTPAKKSTRAREDKWTRMEREWDKKSPHWRSYGEEGPHAGRPFGRVSSRRRSARRSRR